MIETTARSGALFVETDDDEERSTPSAALRLSVMRTSEVDIDDPSLAMVREFILHLTEARTTGGSNSEQPRTASVDWVGIRAAIVGSHSVEQAIGRALVFAHRMSRQSLDRPAFDETLWSSEVGRDSFFGFSVADAVPDFGDHSRYRTRVVRRLARVFVSSKRA